VSRPYRLRGKADHRRDKRTVEPSVHTGVLGMARCESKTILGREVASDASLPRVTGPYKGNRNLDWSDEDSAGPIVPLEGMGQQNPTRGQEPCCSHAVQSRGGGFDGSRARNGTEQVRHLQRTLYRTAKQSKAVKFYSLYDKVWRSDVLGEAGKQVQENQGAPGFRTELENLGGDAKGKGTSGRPTRPKVPKHRQGRTAS
jgi:hypothetical protein